MTSISSVQQIVASIRSGMAGRVQAKSERKSRTDSSGPEQSGMSRLIAVRIKALDPDDPKRGRKAFRIFLESVLLSELGEGLINDPQFYQMVDKIQDAMECDPRIQAAIEQAVAALLNEKPSA